MDEGVAEVEAAHSATSAELADVKARLGESRAFLLLTFLCGPVRTDYLLPTPHLRTRLPTYCSLLTAHCLLPMAYLLRTAYYQWLAS